MKTTIDRAGRLVVPKAVREAAGLQPGVELNIDYQNGAIFIEPVSKVKLVRKGSLLVGTVPGAPKMSLEMSNRLIRRLRNGDL